MEYELTLIQYPSGRYGFVGSVPVELAFVSLDGGVPDPEQVKTAQHCGPGFAKKIKGRSWATSGEALADAKALGFNAHYSL